MDLLIVMGWVLICDIVMVYVTYRLAFREGQKAKEAVEKRYQEALIEVSKLSTDIKTLKIPTVDEIVKALPPIPPIKIPDEELGRLRETICGAIDGKVGSYMKKAGEAADDDDADIGSSIMRMVLGKLTK